MMIESYGVIWSAPLRKFSLLQQRFKPLLEFRGHVRKREDRRMRDNSLSEHTTPKLQKYKYISISLIIKEKLLEWLAPKVCESLMQYGSQ